MTEKSYTQQMLEKKSKTKVEEIYKGRIISLRKETFQVPGGSPAHFDIITHPGAVAMIPVNAQGNLLLVKQWRRAVQKILLEIPAGTLEENEEPLLCAQRELQEEIGFKAATFISLGGLYTAPGFCNEYLHIFIAQDLTPSPLPTDEHEQIDVVEISLEKLLNKIEEHEIEDAKTIASILHYNQWKTHASSRKKI